MSQSRYHLGFTTLNSETTFVELPVRGVIPGWLTGTLIRTAPARFEVGKTAYNHWFDGLAMLHRFDFAANRVFYANRYLRSQSYEEAMVKGTISRGEFATDPCGSLFQKVVSWFFPKLTDNGSVNVVPWNDGIVALTETRLPVQFDPKTLQTLGVREYDRTVKGPISTAHPHYDRTRRRGYNYVLEFGRQSKYHIFSIDGESDHQKVVSTVAVDHPSYMHSFGMTERFLILVEFPFVVNPLTMLFRGQPFIRNYQWRPERRTRFHIVEKDSGRLVRTAQNDAFFAFHHANAFEEGDDVVVDIVVHPDAMVIDQFYLDHLRSAAPVKATGKLTRFRIGAAKDVSSELLSDISIELPRFDYEHRAGQRYRFVYGAGQLPSGDFFNSLVKLDLDQNRSDSWHEEGCYPGEPVFVPGPEPTAEDDGVILSVVLDARRAASFLLILNASTFAELARAEVSHHIPFGFHGNYFR